MPNVDATIETFATMQEYVDRRLIHERELVEERDKFIDEKFSTIEEARRLAKIEQDRRLDTMDEFRGQLKDQASTFVTRELHDQLANKLPDFETHENHDKDLGSLRELHNQIAAKLPELETRENHEKDLGAMREVHEKDVITLRTEMKPALIFTSRSEGGRAERDWFVPSGTTLITALLAVGAFLVAIFSAFFK